MLSYRAQICISLAVVLAASSLARAQSLGEMTSPPSASPHLQDGGAGLTAMSGPGVDWNGPYVGANFIVGNIGFPLNYGDIASVRGIGMTGAGMGGTVGYDRALDNGVVAGIAAEMNGPGPSASYSGVSLSQRSSWALRGRIGVTDGGRTLVYGTAGYAQALESLDLPVNGATQRFSDTISGVVFGGGVETQISDEFFLRGEYLQGVYQPRSHLGVAPSTQAFRLGLIYRAATTSDAGAGVAPMFTPNFSDWSGFYAVALAGADFMSARIGSDSTPRLRGLSAEAPELAAAAGYGRQFGNLYAGMEAELGDAPTVASLAYEGATVLKMSSNWQFAARARAGMALAPNTLAYVAGGWSVAGGTAEVNAGACPQSSHAQFSGPQIGLGIDAMFSETLGGRIEYLQTFYAPQASGLVTPTAGVTRAGLLYHF